MKIASIDFDSHFCPNMSCGTGYSEPDKFVVTLENGNKYELWVDIWYLPNMNSVKKSFISSIEDKFGSTCANVDEAFEMYTKALPWEHRPQFWPKVI